MVAMRGQKMECGSPASNTYSKNTAVIEAKSQNRSISLEEVSEIGYPLRDTFKCFTTWTSKKALKSPRNETLPNGTTIERVYEEPQRSISVGRGLLNTYDGKGYTKIVPLNMTNNPHFFYQAFKQEVFNQNWTNDPA